jgi:hypothetical protein
MRRAVTVLAVLACGCSSSTRSATGPEEAGSTSDAGSVDASLDGADEAGGTGAMPSSILVIQVTPPTGEPFGEVAASFDPRYAAGGGCAQSTSGPCVVQDCSALQAQDAGSPVSDDVGTLALAGGTLQVPLMLPFQAAQQQYRFPLVGRFLFLAGQTMTVSAPGATFPAFSGSSAPGPAPIDITAPVLGTGTSGPTYPFTAGAPLTWSWTVPDGGAGDTVTVTATTSTSLVITCSFDALAGTGTIPADVMAKLQTGPTAVQIASLSTATLAAGGQKVQFVLESSGVQVHLQAQ